MCKTRIPHTLLEQQLNSKHLGYAYCLPWGFLVKSQGLMMIAQVRNFGRRGRTKHTHLVDQDTTVFDDELAPEKKLQDAYFKRVAGVSQTFSKPKTLPINEKRHIDPKNKNVVPNQTRAAYLASKY